MVDLRFSVPTLLLDEKLQRRVIRIPAEPRSELLVITTDSPGGLLPGSLNLFQRIAVISEDFNDGRFFSIARQIRLLGYSGRLTLVGEVLPDQFSALQSCGYNDVLVVADLSAEAIDLEQAVSLAGFGAAIAPLPLPEILNGSNA